MFIFNSIQKNFKHFNNNKKNNVRKNRRIARIKITKRSHDCFRKVFYMC